MQGRERRVLIAAVAVLLVLLLALRVSSEGPVDRPDFTRACGFKVRADRVDVTAMRKDCGIYGPRTGTSGE